jgi:Fe-S-cluster containining protein
MSLAASLSSRSHYLKVGVTGEVFPVTVAQGCLDLYSKKDQKHYDPAWCPFLRRTGEGLFHCTIYADRPAICRKFRCFSLAVTDSSGKVIGRVVGKKTLESDDPELLRTWNRRIMEIGETDPDTWRNKAEKILKDAGYGVIRWED